MERQRDAVVNKIYDIVEAAGTSFPTVAIQVGFMGYRDVTETDSRYDMIPFTSDITVFGNALGAVKCTGGGDEAEDVLGGMQQALTELDWSGARVKVLFHVGDSPHHGALFHDASVGGCNDDHPGLYATPRPYADILADYADQHIDYNFALLECRQRGTVTTREMARLFKASYDSCQSKRNVLDIVDLSAFSVDRLFEKVVKGLTGSICSFLGRKR